MTTWTQPKTWNTGEMVTAALLNEQLRDNMLYLKEASAFDYVEVDTEYSIEIPSTEVTVNWVNVDAANLTLDVTTLGGLVLVGLETNVTGANNTRVMFDLTLDSNRLGGSHGMAIGHHGNSADYTDPLPVRMHHWLPTLAAGSYTFKLQWRAERAASGSDQFQYIRTTASGGIKTRIWVMEFTS